MDHLRKFFRRPAAEQLLLVRALTLLAAVRIALWLCPLKMLQQTSAKLVQACAASRKESRFSTERGVWAVRVASRYIPRATCLTQALAAQILFGLDGIPASVRIGVAKEKAGDFQAHAWLESGGKILIGGIDADQRYTPLLAFSPREH
jgi:Transglutaminase-like superfamily